MFAEIQSRFLPQLSIRTPTKQEHPKGLFRLGPSYEKTKDHAPTETNNSNEVVRQFDLSFSFHGLGKLIDRFGKERGLFQSVLGVMLNIWSVRQEMLGTMDTRELVTLVHKEQGKLTFQNDLYGQAQDLETMYLSGSERVDPHVRERYVREATQAISLFRSLTQNLQRVDFSLPEPLLKEQLELNGFHEEEIDVSPAMLANIGSLRRGITSAQDLQRVVESRPKIRAYIGPAQHLTVSPPHWSHHHGETGFVWASECVVLPDTREIFIRQNGKFAKAREEGLLPYLSYRQQDGRIFSSEAELMAYSNILMEIGYRQPKALLDFLVTELGGLARAGKIDRHIVEGALDIRPYFEAVQTLFALEYERIGGNIDADALKRLGDFSDLMKHQIARNEPKALPAMVEQYASALAGTVASPSLFKEALSLRALQLDTGFKIPIDFSLLDCVAGTPFSLMQSQTLGGLQSGLGGLESIMGKNAYTALRALEGKSISNRAEFESLARRLGKDPSAFTHWGVCQCEHCASKGLENFLGPCGWCLACEVKDDLGIMGTLPDPQENSDELSPRYENEEAYGETEQKRKTSLTTVVASVANPNLLRVA